MGCKRSLLPELHRLFAYSEKMRALTREKGAYQMKRVCVEHIGENYEIGGGKGTDSRITPESHNLNRLLS